MPGASKRRLSAAPAKATSGRKTAPHRGASPTRGPRFFVVDLSGPEIRRTIQKVEEELSAERRELAARRKAVELANDTLQAGILRNQDQSDE